jgi:hypothetical protein
MPAPPPGGPRERATLLETAKAVAASFFGVRGGQAHERDLKRLNPVAVVAMGLVMAAVFVATLLIIVRLVVS